MERPRVASAIAAALRLQFAAAPIAFSIVAVCTIASGGVAAVLG